MDQKKRQALLDRLDDWQAAGRSTSRTNAIDMLAIAFNVTPADAEDVYNEWVKDQIDRQHRKKGS